MFIKNFIKYDFKMADNNASYREENSKFTLISDIFLFKWNLHRNLTYGLKKILAVSLGSFGHYILISYSSFLFSDCYFCSDFMSAIFSFL